MPRFHSTFLGPTAPWMFEDDEEDLVYAQMLRDSADALARMLEERSQKLRNEVVTIDDILDEIRSQATEAGAMGQLGLMGELASLASDLMMAKEDARRVV